MLIRPVLQVFLQENFCIEREADLCRFSLSVSFLSRFGKNNDNFDVVKFDVSTAVAKLPNKTSLIRQVGLAGEITYFDLLKLD